MSQQVLLSDSNSAVSQDQFEKRQPYPRENLGTVNRPSEERTNPENAHPIFLFRARMQIDARWFGQEQKDGSGFVVRRLRPVLEGEFNDFRWYLSPELSGDVRLIDARIEYPVDANHTLSVGKIKHPLGLERSQSYGNTLFIERGLPTQLTPVRDIGCQISGKNQNRLFRWTTGVFNGALDDTDLSTDRPVGSGSPELAFRMEFEPWKHRPDSILAPLRIGAAAAFNRQSITIDGSDRDRTLRYRTSGGIPFFGIIDGVEIQDTTRTNAFLSWNHGSIGILGEWAKSKRNLRLGLHEDTLSCQAWTAQLGWVVTGEASRFDGIVPDSPWNPESGQWGAVEIGMRLHCLEIDDSAFSGFPGWRFAKPDSAQSASAWTVGINWYLTSQLRVSANYEFTRFSGNAPYPENENVFLSRFQVHF